MWTILLSILLLVPCRLLVRLFADKVFFSILVNELDAQKFYKVIYQKNMQPPLLYRFNAEWYVGNYQRLLLLSMSEFDKTTNLAIKCACLAYSARAYFDMHDIENLSKIVDKFYELRNNNPKKNKPFSQYKVFQYYKAYLNKDFQQCIYLAENQVNNLKATNSKQKMQWLTGKCNCAIAYYETGDFDKAKEIFEYFIEKTPGLQNFTNLSHMYLKAIRNKDKSYLSYNICKEDCEAQEINNKKRKHVCIWIVSILLIFFLFGIEFATRTNYENKLRNILDEEYDQVQVIEYFEIEKGNEYADTFCIVDTDEGLKIVSVVDKDRDTPKIILLYDNPDTDTYYYVKSAVSDYYIGFTLGQSPSKATNIYYEIEFIYNNVKYWLSIDYIDTYI